MNDWIVVLPSESLSVQSTYLFSLQVTTAFLGSGEASVEVFKSADALPSLKVCPPLVWVTFASTPRTFYNLDRRCSTLGERVGALS